MDTERPYVEPVWEYSVVDEPNPRSRALGSRWSHVHQRSTPDRPPEATFDVHLGDSHQGVHAMCRMSHGPPCRIPGYRLALSAVAAFWPHVNGMAGARAEVTLVCVSLVS